MVLCLRAPGRFDTYFFFLHICRTVPQCPGIEGLEDRGFLKMRPEINWPCSNGWPHTQESVD